MCSHRRKYFPCSSQRRIFEDKFFVQLTRENIWGKFICARENICKKNICSSQGRRRVDSLVCFTASSFQKDLMSKFAAWEYLRKVHTNFKKLRRKNERKLFSKPMPRLQKDMQNEARNPLIDVEDWVSWVQLSTRANSSRSKKSKSQNNKITKSQDHKITKSQDQKILRSQNHKIEKSQDQKITRLHENFPDHDTTLPADAHWSGFSFSPQRDHGGLILILQICVSSIQKKLDLTHLCYYLSILLSYNGIMEVFKRNLTLQICVTILLPYNGIMDVFFDSKETWSQKFFLKADESDAEGGYIFTEGKVVKKWKENYKSA